VRAVLAALILLATSPVALADITIATAGPMKGQHGVFGEQMKRGAEAAIEAVNAAGGINGEVLRLEAVDDGCDAKTATAVAQDLIARDVRFVAGHFCSGASLAAAPIYEAASVLMVTPAASHPRLTDAGHWNVFRLVQRDDAQGEVAARRMARLTPGLKTAVLDDGQPPSAALAQRFTAASATPPLAISFKAGAESYAGLVNDLEEAGIGAVYLACAPAEAGRITRQIREKNPSIAIYGSDSLLTEEFGRAAGEASDGVLATFAADPMVRPEAANVVKALQDRDIVAEGAVIPTYAAVQAFAAAAKAQGVNDGQAMARWLHSANAIDTVVGAVAFDAKGDLKTQPFVWYRWQAGKFARETD
jgi:branched-chain amino acid transport system substrate-binding protein